MPQQFKGKVIYVSKPKQGRSGWFTGFKIDTMPEDFLNDFKDDVKMLIKTKMGDSVSGTFEVEGKYNVVKTFALDTEPKAKNALIPRTDFKVGDEVNETDLVIEYNTRLLQLITDAFLHTDVYKLFENDKEQLQKILVTLFLTIHEDLRK